MSKPESAEAGSGYVRRKLTETLSAGIGRFLRFSVRTGLDAYMDILLRHQVSAEGADAWGWEVNRRLGKRYE